jgi:putative FmdB family regulatory protein
MPIYEYQCPDCGHVFEKLMGSDKSEKCPLCQADAVKIMSVPGYSKLKTPAYGVV